MLNIPIINALYNVPQLTTSSLFFHSAFTVSWSCSFENFVVFFLSCQNGGRNIFSKKGIAIEHQDKHKKTAQMMQNKVL